MKVTKEGAFGRTYFRGICSSVTGKWYKQSWKESDQLKDIDQKFLCSDYCDHSGNIYGVKCGTLLRFWESKGSINEIDPHDILDQWYFRYWLGRRFENDRRQINRWKKIVSSFSGKLVKVIKYAGCKFDSYSTSPKIRQILLRWSYELTEKDFLLTWF